MTKTCLILSLLCFALAAPRAGSAGTLQIEELTWEEVGAAIEAGTDTAIITIGATEQHGPQIALASDSITGDYLAEAIAHRLGRALIAPNIRVGISPHHMYFPGTITVRSDILVHLVMEYVHSLVWHGFRHIAIIPTHGGNFGLVAEAGRRLSTLYPYVNVMAFSDADGYIGAMTSTTDRLGVSAEVAGSHAGMSETSMALAARPDLVRMDRAQPGFMGDAYGAGIRLNTEGTKSLSPIGVMGDPRPATAEYGKAYLGDLADYLGTYFQRGRENWQPAPAPELPSGGLAEPEGELAEGIRARRAGDIAAAKAFFEAHLRRDPGQAEPRAQLARTLILEGDTEAARALLTPLLGSDDFQARILGHDELALVALYRGRFGEAVEHKLSARELAERHGGMEEEIARRYMQVGYILTEFGQLDAAAEAFAEAQKRVPDAGPLKLDIQHLAALAELRQGRPHLVIGKLRAIGDAIFDAGLTNQLRRFYQLDAELRIADGHPADALIGLSRAIRIYDHPLYRETQARALIALGRLDEAEESLQRITRLTDARLDIPTMFVRAHYRLGTIYEAQGRTHDAARLYTAFLDYWGGTDAPLDEVRLATEALGRLPGAQ